MKNSVIEAPQVVRKIQCPRHFLIHPSVDVYKKEIVPEFKNVSDYLVREGKARKTRTVKDKLGRPVVDWKKVYEHKRKGNGKVLQPFVTCKWAIENIYDPKHWICVMQCKGRCKRGQGTIKETTIKRLNG